MLVGVLGLVAVTRKNGCRVINKGCRSLMIFPPDPGGGCRKTSRHGIIRVFRLPRYIEAVSVD